MTMKKFILLLKEHLFLAILTALTISFLGLFLNPISKILEIFLAEISLKISKLLVLKLWVGLLFILLALILYIIYLLHKIKLKINFRFGVYWDKKLKPLCPVCGSIMSDKKPQSKNIICPSCGKSILLWNDNYNKELTYKEAVEILRDEI